MGCGGVNAQQVPVRPGGPGDGAVAVRDGFGRSAGQVSTCLARPGKLAPVRGGGRHARVCALPPPVAPSHRLRLPQQPGQCWCRPGTCHLICGCHLLAAEGGPAQWPTAGQPASRVPGRRAAPERRPDGSQNPCAGVERLSAPRRLLTREQQKQNGEADRRHHALCAGRGEAMRTRVLSAGAGRRGWNACGPLCSVRRGRGRGQGICT